MRNSLFISNFKCFIGRIITIIILASISCMGWLYYCNLVQYPRDNFYDFYNTLEKDTVDVLCVGSSHVYCGINPVQLYNDYGIAAYDLAAGSQAIWYSYFYIKEALKTQNPKVVVLDVYTIPTRDDYFTREKAQANLINMSISYNKWEALEVAEIEDKLDIFWRFPITHTRYKALKKEDYDLLGNMNTFFLGYCYKTKIEPYELDNIVDVREVKDIGSISEKAEKYLRKCIELCQNRGIEIVLTNTPWPDITIETQQQYNKIQQIAEEYGVAFLNGCLMNEELGMDYRVDSMGDWGHLNYTGVTKWTKWLGSYLANKYELPDRRGDSKYKMWEYQSAKLNARIRMDNIAQAEDLESLAHSLQQTDGLCCAIEIRGDYLRGDMGIPETILGKQLDLTRRGGYIIRDGKIIDYGDGRQDYNLCLYLNNCVMNVRSIGEDKAIIFDGNKYTMVENGINIVVYDEYLKQIVGKFGIDVDNGHKLVK